MPMELGLFLGCKRFVEATQHKNGRLILDIEKYRYRNFLSDMAGQDIHAHGGETERAIAKYGTG